MYSTIAFVFVTTLLVCSEQAAVSPAVPVPAPLQLSKPTSPQTFIAKPAEHQVQVTPTKTVPAVEVHAAVHNPDLKLQANVPVKIAPGHVVLPAVSARPLPAPLPSVTAQHSIKTRQVAASLNEELLASLGELQASAADRELEGRNRRIKVLPAFLG